MKHNKYYWLIFTILLLITGLLASAEKQDINNKDLTNSTRQIIEETYDIPLSNDVEPILSTVRAGSEINWQVISTGGNISQSGNNLLGGSVGQTATFSAVSGDNAIKHGFWQNFAITSCDCEPGEADGSSPINILDIVYLINYKYKNGPEPIPYPICSGDPNIDCIVNILDIVYLINFKYKEGPAPAICKDWIVECNFPLRN